MFDSNVTPLLHVLLAYQIHCKKWMSIVMIPQNLVLVTLWFCTKQVFKLCLKVLEIDAKMLNFKGHCLISNTSNGGFKHLILPV